VSWSGSPSSTTRRSCACRCLHSHASGCRRRRRPLTDERRAFLDEGRSAWARGGGFRGGVCSPWPHGAWQRLSLRSQARLPRPV
jgi:hypothetical protein